MIVVVKEQGILNLREERGFVGSIGVIGWHSTLAEL